jgi:hypothetical protein
VSQRRAHGGAPSATRFARSFFVIQRVAACPRPGLSDGIVSGPTLTHAQPVTATLAVTGRPLA